MKKSQVGINAASTQVPLKETVEAYAGAGFENIEFPLPLIKEYINAGNSVCDVKGLFKKNGVKCIGGFELGVDCFSHAEERKKNHDQVIGNARLLSELGAGTMVVGTNGPSDWNAPDLLGQMAEVFAEVGEKIKDTGVVICIEFNWSPIVKSLRTAAEIARRSKSRNVGVVFDPAHYHCTPSKFDQINPKNVRYIKHVHMDDMRDKPGELSDCNGDRVLPGKGCLDLKAMIKQLEKFGYKGYFAIEMFNAELYALPAPKAAKLMYNSMMKLCGK